MRSGKSCPVLSEEPAFNLDVKYAGETVASKLARIREEMKEAGTNVHVVSTIDDICWTLNIRGNDITSSHWYYLMESSQCTVSSCISMRKN